MRNFPEWSLAFWAAAVAGAVVVPLNAWWTKPELAYGLEDSGSKVVFVDGERYDRLGPRPNMIVARPEGRTPGAERFQDVLGDAWHDPSIALPAVDLDPEDEATIFYTSGTTGVPKGALGTHRNICGNLMSLGFGQARAAMRAGVDPTQSPSGEQ